MAKAVFMDRDGVINEICYHHDVGVYSAKSMDEFKVKDGVKEAIQKLKDMGFLIVVVSNQPGVAFKYIKEEDLAEISEFMMNELKVDRVYNCTHHPHHTGECECRKPKKGMFKQAAKDLDIDIKESYMIGDNLSDIKSGEDCKKTILITPARIDIYHVIEKKKIFPDFTVTNIQEAVEKIKECEK